MNQFNRGLGKHDLQQLVGVFNKTYAGKEDANGALIPLIVLPGHYEFGDPLLTQDLRLSRNSRFGDCIQLAPTAEVFNLCDISNLSGRSKNLLTPGFGQPRSRLTQVFGSGGPRAFRIGARARFGRVRLNPV